MSRAKDQSQASPDELVLVSFRIPRKTLDAYDALSSKTGVPRSDLLRAASREHLPKAQRAAGIIMHPVSQIVIRGLKASSSKADEQELQELIDMYEHSKLKKQQATHLDEPPTTELAT